MRRKSSPMILSRICGYVPLRYSTLSRSISTALNASRGFFTRYCVSTPIPGPISKTGMSGQASTVSAIRCATFRSVRKCCPRFFFGFTCFISIMSFFSFILYDRALSALSAKRYKVTVFGRNDKDKQRKDKREERGKGKENTRRASKEAKPEHNRA